MLNQVLTSGVDFDPAGSAAAAQAASQPLDADLTAIAALTTTSFGRGGLTQVDAAAFRSYIAAGTGSGNALTSNPLSQFAATSSAQLAGVISDETGTGLLVFNTSPTFVTPILGTPTSGNLANCTGYPGVPAAANPTASVGLTAVNGTATSFMRSDGAPPLDVTIAPTWTGAHTFSNATTTYGAAGTAPSITSANVQLTIQTSGGGGSKIILTARDSTFRIDDGGSGFTFTSAGARSWIIDTNNFRAGSGKGIGWSSAADPGGAQNDTTMTRAAAGVVGVPSAIATQTAVGTNGIVVKGIASRTVALLNLQTSAGASLGNVGGTIFNDFTDTSTTHTDGTEDDLYSYTTVANTLIINGDSVSQKEHIHIVANSTATRRIKKYFAGTLIWDSGDVTGQLNVGGAVNTELWLETTVIRESSTVVRVTVRSITTFTVATVPFVTYTRITGLTLTGTNILKTTGIASGTGAASGDVVNKMSKVITEPAA